VTTGARAKRRMQARGLTSPWSVLVSGLGGLAKQFRDHLPQIAIGLLVFIAGAALTYLCYRYYH
jgi:hypothetical protein